MPGSSRLRRRRASWLFFHHALTTLAGRGLGAVVHSFVERWSTPVAGAPAAAGSCHVPSVRPLPRLFAARPLCAGLRRGPGAACNGGDHSNHPRVGPARANAGGSVRHSGGPARDAAETGDPAQLLPRPAPAGAGGNDLRPARPGPAVRRQCDLHRQRNLAAPPGQLPGLHPAVRDACPRSRHPGPRAGSGTGGVVVPGPAERRGLQRRARQRRRRRRRAFRYRRPRPQRALRPARAGSGQPCAGLGSFLQQPRRRVPCRR
ncbi:hypothetical protein G6F65_018726 [Rhizopus arrhizus]|nr:hypothetical protein G6F65_018726 [Rhizopus arrhizus]